MSERAHNLLQISGATKSFPGVRALEDVTFDVLAGEVHGLVGENGAGKSTLMAVASGAMTPDSGTVMIDGTATVGAPQTARALGLAIVRQEPALMPDLTVAENLFLGVPANLRPSVFSLTRWADDLLRTWNKDVSVRASDRVDTLNPEQRFIVEIVKALANEPKVLVLDEPTEHLPAEDVGRLFTYVRQVTSRGACVVYISHRIREVQQIADRLTVLRDGRSQGTFDTLALNEDQIVELIVGVSLDREFPAKLNKVAGEALRVENLSGPGFANVNLTVQRGEIFGLAGISDNGQHEFMRALAGLNRSRGVVKVNNRDAWINSSKNAIRNGIAYLPGDRHREGIFADLSVRENFSIRSTYSDVVGGIVDPRRETRRVEAAIDAFAVKTPAISVPIASLSGGNQQKVVLSSVLATQPSVLLVDEPTQGVDVGARMEIYRSLREIAEKGVAIIALSSDASEIAGLCDRVAIFSRGQVAHVISGDQVSENAILSSALKSTLVRDKSGRAVHGFWKWAAGNAAPLAMLTLAIALMGVVAAGYNPFYLSTRNISGMMVLAATLALVAYGQQLLILVGGIDLSVGPVMGLAQVVGSFFLLSEASAGQQAIGWAAMLAACCAVGILNWLLVEPLKLHPMVATLATFMGVQAVSLSLRPTPDGTIDANLLELLGAKIGFVPLSFLCAVSLGALLEYLLYRHRLGFVIRGLGSRAEAARVAGVAPARVRLLAYVGCSLLAFVAAITMVAQVGIGDPRAGLGYTLTSIASVVIGGGSLFGGRGSFIGALLGAIFITQVNTVTNFLGLDEAWQSYLLGGMIVVAVALFSKSRQLAVAT
jgi:ribose transport system ATP-binding protein